MYCMFTTFLEEIEIASKQANDLLQEQMRALQEHNLILEKALENSKHYPTIYEYMGNATPYLFTIVIMIGILFFLPGGLPTLFDNSSLVKSNSIDSLESYHSMDYSTIIEATPIIN